MSHPAQAAPALTAHAPIALIYDDPVRAGSLVEALEGFQIPVVAWSWGKGVSQLLARTRPALLIFDCTAIHGLTQRLLIRRLQREGVCTGLRMIACIEACALGDLAIHCTVLPGRCDQQILLRAIVEHLGPRPKPRGRPRGTRRALIG